MTGERDERIVEHGSAGAMTILLIGFDRQPAVDGINLSAASGGASRNREVAGTVVASESAAPAVSRLIVDVHPEAGTVGQAVATDPVDRPA